MCVCVLVVPFLGFYTILFYTLFESLYSQNYCCCASDKVIWGRTIEREQRKGAKSILCSSAIKRKHNSIVRIFIEQASIRKVHLIKLCTFKLHTLALAHSHSQRWISNNDSDNEQWIYEICIRDIDGMYNVHTHFAWNLFQLCRVKQFLLVCSSVHSMPCCPHLMMFINLLVGSCCTSDCLLRSIVRHLFCQSVTHAHTHPMQPKWIIWCDKTSAKRERHIQHLRTTVKCTCYIEVPKSIWSGNNMVGWAFKWNFT